MRIILASQSERRKELLNLMRLQYEVMVSNADETLEPDLKIEEQSKKLAYIKAKDIFDKTTGDRLVIGSDTLVIKDDKIYGKPRNEKDAIQMVEELQGNKHQVITSICVLVENHQKYEEYIDYDIAEVYIKNMDTPEIEKWVKENEVMDKAGAYAIQGKFAVHVEKIDGNYTTIVGLPVHKLYDILKKCGI